MLGLVDTGQQGNPFILNAPTAAPGLPGVIGLLQNNPGALAAANQVTKKFGIDLKTPGQHKKERMAEADRLYGLAAQGDPGALDKLYGLSGRKSPTMGAATDRDYFWARYQQAKDLQGSANGNPATLGGDKMNVAPGNFFSQFGFPKDWGSNANGTNEVAGIPVVMIAVLVGGLLLLRRGMKS